MASSLDRVTKVRYSKTSHASETLIPKAIERSSRCHSDVARGVVRSRNPAHSRAVLPKWIASSNHSTRSYRSSRLPRMSVKQVSVKNMSANHGNGAAGLRSSHHAGSTNASIG